MNIFIFLLLAYTLSCVNAVQWCEKDIYEADFHIPGEELEVLVIWFPVRAGAHNILQLCSNFTGQPVERHCAYDRHGKNATWDVIDKSTKLINCSSIVNECYEEPFSHEYVLKKQAREKHTNHWQGGKVGEMVSLQEPCLLESGLPLTRKCMYQPNNYMAQWEPIENNEKFENVRCLREIKQHIVTFELNDLYQHVRNEDPIVIDEKDRLEVATKLEDLLAQPNTTRIPADLSLSTEILEIITLDEKKPEMLPKVVGITDLLMRSDGYAVNESSQLNTPNRLIKTVEKYYDDMANLMVPTAQCGSIESGVKYKTANMTSLFVINPHCSNVSGIAVYNASILMSSHRPPSLLFDINTNTFIRYLYLNQSLNELLTEPHLEVASFFPEHLWRRLLIETEGKTNIEAVRFAIYRNGYFFVDQRENGYMPDGLVLTISIPEYRGDLPDDLPFILRHSQAQNQESAKCGYWDYHTWNDTGVNTTNQHVDNLVLCQTTHLTPFCVYIGLHTRPLKIANSAVLTAMEWNESVLDIISIIGSGLSLFGLLCIWITAMCFKQWRSQSSNKVLLNMCFVLTLMMAYFLVINVTEIRDSFINMKNEQHCIGIGAFLHYIVLVLFFWMLIVAILQYQRYVIVMGIERPSNYVLKYSLAAWGLPLIPTATVVHFDPGSYMPHTEKDNDKNPICYPSGKGLYYGVMLPITVIIVANVGIFIYIVCSIYRSMNKFKEHRDRKNLLMQVRLSILLFFLLGISWLFGVLAHLNEGMVFPVLFCLTSTMQGFVLFVYFIIIDQSTRYTWLKLCCSKEYRTMEDTSMTPLTYLNSHQ